MQTTLYYIHDPMCSWCWGHRSLWDALQKKLPESIRIEYVAGGLAPDTDIPMPVEMQETIQGYWREIQSKLETEFNFEFWTNNTPRRSTYIACRAVIAAKNQGCEKPMIDALQRAYYLRALNPSDKDILLRLAWELYSQELELDLDRFTNDLESMATHKELERQIIFARELTTQGFPSMVLEHQGSRYSIVREYKNVDQVLAEIKQVVSGSVD